MIETKTEIKVIIIQHIIEKKSTNPKTGFEKINKINKTKTEKEKQKTHKSATTAIKGSISLLIAQ